MKTLSTSIMFAVVISIFGGIVYFSYDGRVYLFNQYSTLESSTRIILLTASGTLFVCSLILASAIRKSGSGINAIPVIESKLKLYKAILDIYKPAATDSLSDFTKLSQYVFSNMEGLESELKMIAAVQVLSSHKKLQQSLIENQSPETLPTLYEQLVKAIRRDLGHNDSHISDKIDFFSATKIENLGPNPIERVNG